MAALIRRVAQAVTARQAAEFYGLEIRANKTRCLWHDDRRPSLSFDRRTGRCRCFSCGKGGDAVDLVGQLFGLSALGASQKIDTDFDLHLDGVALTPAERKSFAQRDRQRQARRVAAAEYDVLCESIQAINGLLDVVGNEDSDLTWLAVRRRAEAELEMESVF